MVRLGPLVHPPHPHRHHLHLHRQSRSQPYASGGSLRMGTHIACRKCGKDIHVLGAGSGPDKCPFCNCLDPTRRRQARFGT